MTLISPSLKDPRNPNSPFNIQKHIQMIEYLLDKGIPTTNVTPIAVHNMVGHVNILNDITIANTDKDVIFSNFISLIIASVDILSGFSSHSITLTIVSNGTVYTHVANIQVSSDGTALGGATASVAGNDADEIADLLATVVTSAGDSAEEAAGAASSSSS